MTQWFCNDTLHHPHTHTGSECSTCNITAHSAVDWSIHSACTLHRQLCTLYCTVCTHAADRVSSLETARGRYTLKYCHPKTWSSTLLDLGLLSIDCDLMLMMTSESHQASRLGPAKFNWSLMKSRWKKEETLLFPTFDSVTKWLQAQVLFSIAAICMYVFVLF